LSVMRDMRVVEGDTGEVSRGGAGDVAGEVMGKVSGVLWVWSS
jgi:hypothetical protein